MSTADALFELQDITKTFPGVTALDRVSLAFAKGEVHALVGENGAGKSTMMKLLSGVYHPTSGRMLLDGEEFAPYTPFDAQKAGVSIIFQEFSLIPVFTVWENVFLNREPRNGAGIVNAREARRRTRALLEALAVEIDIEKKVSELSVVEQQMVEIAKALSVDARLLIMDEPSATLTDREVEKLFGVVRGLKARGVTVIYISHLLEEVFAIADRVSVMKDGAHVLTKSIDEIDKDSLVRAMVGRPVQDYFPQRAFPDGDLGERLAIRNLVLKAGGEPIDIVVGAGEIVGVFGLVGSGQYRLVRSAIGVDRPIRGEVSVDGKKQRFRSPRDAVAAGIALVTEDRKRTGILSSLSVRANTVIADLKKHSKAGIAIKKLELASTLKSIKDLTIKCSGPAQPIATLSGGNQQKVLIARWLVRNPKILILMEPTRGIDVGAKAEIYRVIHSLAERGHAVLIISEELPEVIGLSDRVLVMRDQTIAGEIDQRSGRASEEEVMALAVGHEYKVEGVELA